MSPHRNRLARESSPYLRQHAANPVDWYPWGPEALERAKAEDKPIFLSVGYSSCHWCHVMEHESFERDDVAEVMNTHFVCIKVDREEHPDLDALYMIATQLVTQRGGWPNSVWLTPDGRPWYAGTYFPREDRHGRIGFVTLLKRLAGLWKERRKDVEEQANTLTKAIHRQHERTASADVPAVEPTEMARHIEQHFLEQFDPRNGGFGEAPKFPPHSGLLLLLRCQTFHPDPRIATVIERTLDAMLRGGICDQIGGGFHRYATDDHWLVPHFEKMLYDNALLLDVYARAYAVFQRPAYRRVALDIAAWLARQLTHPEGGFYSALDADSEGEEGKYYTWSHDDFAGLLDPATLAAFASEYQILPGGNYADEASGHPTGLNIPHLAPSVTEDVVAALSTARETLLARRSERVPPGLDDKIITGWNGLMIRALATASRIFNEPRLLDQALAARTFIERHLFTEARLARCWCGTVSAREGVLEDYAAIALADITLFSVTGETVHLDRARRGADLILAHFYDAASDELFMTSNREPANLLRMKDLYDQGSPSGIGLAVQALARIGQTIGDHALVETARRLADRQVSIIQRMPSAVASLAEGWLLAGGTPMTHVPSVTWRIERDGADVRVIAESPTGWHVTVVELSVGGVAIPVAPAAAHHQWRVKSAGAGDVTVRYQVCTDTECLPAQEVRINPNN